MLNKIKLLLLLIFFLPLTILAQDNCFNKTLIVFKDPMLMCPHLGPKIKAELNALSKCEVIEKNKNELIFYSDTKASRELIDSLLIKKIYLPAWEIDTVIYYDKK